MADEVETLDALTDVALEREIYRAQRLSGDPNVRPSLVKALSSEWRRLLRILDLPEAGPLAMPTVEDFARARGIRR